MTCHGAGFLNSFLGSPTFHGVQNGNPVFLAADSGGLYMPSLAQTWQLRLPTALPSMASRSALKKRCFLSASPTGPHLRGAKRSRRISPLLVILREAKRSRRISPLLVILREAKRSRRIFPLLVILRGAKRSRRIFPLLVILRGAKRSRRISADDSDFPKPKKQNSRPKPGVLVGGGGAAGVYGIR